MHVESEFDPAPDSEDFASDVLCEHGNLSINTLSRRRISAEAAELLQNLYPFWRPPPTSSELCPICDANIHISKENRREVRKQAEDETAILKDLYDALLSGNTSTTEGISFALIPMTFAKAWRRWLTRPTECARPGDLDTTSLFCEHGLLVVDPNCTADLESSAVVIKRDHWDVLNAIYVGGRLIAVEKEPQAEDGPSKYIHEILICAECRFKQKTDWTTAEITIRIGGSKPPTQEKPSKKGLKTYAKAGARQSNRLRQIKELGEKRRLTVSKSTTVKELKIMIQEELNIPTICQRLFHHSKELDDNFATVELLTIFAGDILDLKQENEVLEIDSDTDTRENRPRDEERGFGGTLLGGSSNRNLDRTPSSPPPPSEGTAREKSCGACTFANDADALSCTICDTPFT
ncbi:hypothetical protein DXG03_000816 [Asterophora parasitica]|uniref:Uncharacterized protein n=1 Tax=Asterophora parasitica TaxID=117018 RepID=A0A9P7KFW8_9AGAR|nr:hypothetical protein DXG03_000816 [Asterophora parasitica]